MDVREGQEWRALRDVDVAALTHWEAPFTGGGQGTLPAGSVVRVLYDPPETATAIGCGVADSARLEPRFVTDADRLHPKYAGYSLSIMRDVLQRDFELISSPP